MFQMEYFELNTYGLRGKCHDDINGITWEGTISWTTIHDRYGYTKQDLKVSPQKCWDLVEDFANDPSEVL